MVIYKIGLHEWIETFSSFPRKRQFLLFSVLAMVYLYTFFSFVSLLFLATAAIMVRHTFTSENIYSYYANLSLNKYVF